jgi:predicted SAM-dependent methyltransferase
MSSFQDCVARVKRSLQFGKLSFIKAWIKKLNPPAYPKNPDGRVLIHLGCGDQDDARYINVDALPFSHVHHVHGVTTLPMFSDSSADLLYASHLLEHVSHKHALATLREWVRVLKPGGVLRIAVPDFDALIHVYQEQGNDIRKIQKPLMGAQDYAFNFHMGMFTESYLTELLKEAGCKNVRAWDPKNAPDYTFHDGAFERVCDYPISLNLEATKS